MVMLFLADLTPTLFEIFFFLQTIKIQKNLLRIIVNNVSPIRYLTSEVIFQIEEILENKTQKL